MINTNIIIYVILKIIDSKNRNLFNNMKLGCFGQMQVKLSHENRYGGNVTLRIGQPAYRAISLHIGQSIVRRLDRWQSDYHTQLPVVHGPLFPLYYNIIALA